MYTVTRRTARSLSAHLKVEHPVEVEQNVDDQVEAEELAVERRDQCGVAVGSNEVRQRGDAEHVGGGQDLGADGVGGREDGEQVGSLPDAPSAGCLCAAPQPRGAAELTPGRA